MDRDSRKPTSGAVDDSSKALLERAKLIRERGLELQAELQLGLDRSHVLVMSCQRLAKSVSGSLRKTQLIPGTLAPPVDIGTQVRTGDPAGSNRLKSRPILRRKKRLVLQPLRDGLLRDGGSIHELSDAFREGGLAAGDIDSAPKGGNVLLFHKSQSYTTRVVRVNESSRVPKNNEVCNVLSMPVSPRKRALPKSEQLPEGAALVGPDGLTLGDRLRLGMQARSQAIGRTYTAKDLLADASAVAGRGPNDPPVQTQQALSKILNNRVSESAAVPAYAAVLGLNSLWLQYGTGPRSFIETLQKARK